ncbi:hypothetical protein BGZ76_008318, partial [Entomortierella beljakovae]
MAAMRFNFSSLPAMQSLRSFTIRDLDSDYTTEITNEYMIRQHKIPSSQPASPTDSPTQPMGLFGSYTFNAWTLPNLTSIHMTGSPVSIFCLEYLRNFPSLEFLRLSTVIPVNIQRTPNLVSDFMDSINPDLDEYEYR